MLAQHRINGLGGDAALISGIAGHHDVALHAPRDAPAVADLPVSAQGQRAVAHNGHPVVEIGSGAARVVEDAAMIIWTTATVNKLGDMYIITLLWHEIVTITKHVWYT